MTEEVEKGGESVGNPYPQAPGTYHPKPPLPVGENLPFQMGRKKIEGGKKEKHPSQSCGERESHQSKGKNQKEGEKDICPQ